MSKLLFPSVLIVLDVAAAIVYLGHGDYRMFGYWVSAAVLTSCVTY